MVLLPLLLRLSVALAASPWGPEPAPAGWAATDATWRLTIRDGEPIRVEADYALASPASRGDTVQLVGPELLITEAEGPVRATPRGLELALGPTALRHEQHVEGLLPDPGNGRLVLAVLPATRARVLVDAPGLDVTIDGAVDGWIGPRDQLVVSWRPHVEGETPRESLLAQGEAATVFRAEGGSLLVEGVMRWRVVRGEAKRLTFDAGGLEELEVAGPGVAKWRREGSQVVIEPKAPVKGLFAVTIRGRAPLGKGERAVPGPQPAGVQRVDRYVTMARSDEGELIPVAMPTSVPLGQLPAWAKNLGDGVPLVAWRGPQPVRVLNGDFEGMQGPDTMVTQARFTVAAAREGRVALRMNLRVRNERRQYLHVAALPGWRPIVVRVGNQPVSGLGDGAGGLYIPLEKSVETVKGLLSFPVDVEWVGTDLAEWERRGEMTLTLPAIDAPIQAAAWEVHLPRGFRALRAPTSGQGTVLLGDLRGGDELEDQSGYAEEERRKQEVVSSALQNAVTAYKGNDWSTAQRWLDEAKNVDSGNEDAQLLQENLDVIEGRSTRNDLGARRVKDLARAKSSGLESQQADVEKTAETLLRSGDLDAAEAAWEEALQVANELTKVQQVEDVEQKTRASTASKKLADIRDAKQKRGGSASFSGASVTVTESTTTVADGNTGWGEEDEDEGGVPGGVVGGEVGGVLHGIGVPSADEPSTGSDAGIGGLIGGLGTRGTGIGGGGTAESLGNVGAKGRGGGGASSAGEDVDQTVAFEVEEEEPAPVTLALDEEAPRKEVAAKADRARLAEKAESKPADKKKSKAEAPAEPPPAAATVTTANAAGPMAKAPPVSRGRIRQPFPDYRDVLAGRDQHPGHPDPLRRSSCANGYHRGARDRPQPRCRQYRQGLQLDALGLCRDFAVHGLVLPAVRCGIGVCPVGQPAVSGGAAVAATGHPDTAGYCSHCANLGYGH